MSFPISDKGIPTTSSQQSVDAPSQQTGSLRGRKAKRSNAASTSLTQALPKPSTSTAQQATRPFTRSVAKRMREGGAFDELQEPAAKKARLSTAEVEVTRVVRARKRTRLEVEDITDTTQAREPPSKKIKTTHDVTSLQGPSNEFRLLTKHVTQPLLDKLEEVAKIEDNNARASAIEEWLTQYHSHFDQKTLESLDTTDLCCLTSRLIQCECSELPSYTAIFQNLPAAGKSYAQLLQLPLTDFWEKQCQAYQGPSQESNRYTGLAYYIACKKLPMAEVAKRLNEKELGELVPYLRYGDFLEMEYGTAERLLAGVTSLQYAQEVYVSVESATLPALPACRGLDCSLCSNLTALPALPLCTNLNCSACKKLTALPDLPFCTTLACSECSGLTRLPALPLCTNLDCDSCKRLTELPPLPVCKDLGCSGCSKLQALPDLPACITLECEKCSELTALPALPLCTNLDCSSCKKLTTLPASLPACVSLSCDKCFELTVLPQLPLCASLHCSSCRALTALPDLPACTRVDCSNCAMLSVLPPALPVCTSFTCEDCPRLGATMPEMPYSAQVYTGTSTPLQFANLAVEVSEVASYPKKILLELGRTYLFKNRLFPNIHYLENGKLSNAVDVGGVRRDLVSRIIESLISRTPPSENRLALDHEGFPELVDKQDADCFRTLGRLLALCYHSHSPFKTGPLFPEEFYKKIAVTPWVDDMTDEGLISNYLHFRELDVIAQVANPVVDLASLDDNSLSMAAYFLDIDTREQEPRSFFGDTGNRTLLRNAIIKATKDDKRFQAAALMAQEMKAALTSQEWNELRAGGGDALHDRVEGELSAELLLSKLQITQEDSVTATQGRAVAEYLKNWIGQAPIEDLRTFVRAVTSNNTLGKESIIKVDIVKRGPDFIPVAHTCFFTIELSGEYPDQETFNKKINVLLKEGMAGIGFQIA